MKVIKKNSVFMKFYKIMLSACCFYAAYLSCESGEMIVKINFSEPFRGIAYADYDRSSPCKFYGDGGRYYEMRMPLKGCGTKQVNALHMIHIDLCIFHFKKTLKINFFITFF